MKKASDLRIPFTWNERRSIWVDRFFYVPVHYDRHADWKPIPWSDAALFGNNNPVNIEYCSGNGQWICERAKAEPAINWVAVEKRFDRARKIWLRLHKENIPNLLVVCSEGVIFTRYYVPRSSIDQVFVNFPDPWPKLRHSKHRIIRPEFLAELEGVTTSCAKAIFVTDNLPYANEMIQTALERTNWQSLLPKPYYETQWPEYGESYFYDLWKKKGREIYYLRFEVRS